MIIKFGGFDKAMISYCGFKFGFRNKMVIYPLSFVSSFFSGGGRNYFLDW